MKTFLVSLCLLAPVFALAGPGERGGTAVSLDGNVILRILSKTSARGSTLTIDRSTLERALFCHSNETKMALIAYALRAGEQPNDIVHKINSDFIRCAMVARPADPSEATAAILAPGLSLGEIDIRVSGLIGAGSRNVVIQSPDMDLESLIADLRERHPQAKVTVVYDQKNN